MSLLTSVVLEPIYLVWFFYHINQTPCFLLLVSSPPQTLQIIYLITFFFANFWDTNLIIQAGLLFTSNSSSSCFYLQSAGLQMCTTTNGFFSSGNTVLCLMTAVVLSNCLTIVINLITTHFQSSSDIMKLNACYVTSLWKVLFLRMESTLTESLPDTNDWSWIHSPPWKSPKSMIPLQVTSRVHSGLWGPSLSFFGATEVKDFFPLNMKDTPPYFFFLSIEPRISILVCVLG